MKQVNNRQKMFVKPKRDVQKFVVAAGRVRMTESRKQTSRQKLVPLYGLPAANKALLWQAGMPKGGRDRRQKRGGKRK